MPHSTIESIRQRLESTRRRHNLSVALVELGRWLLSCSLLFIIIVAIGNVLGFSESSTWTAVFLTWALGVFAITFLCMWRLLGRWQDSRHFVHRLEQSLPDLEQRLITSAEFESGEARGVSTQFIDKLIEDVQLRVQARPLQGSVSFKAAYRALGLAGVAMIGLITLLFLSEGFLQASRQLASSIQHDVAALPLAIHVEPGNVAMQRGDDLTIVASLDDASSEQLALYVQDDHLNWRRLSMAPDSGQTQASAKVFSADLPQLTQDLVYYVEYREGSGAKAEAIRSPQYRVSLFDLPRVDGLELAYDFPDYTGLENKVENPGGDVVAPEGTTINVRATLNKQVKAARLVFEDGKSVPLTLDKKRASGSFRVSNDTHYRIELIDIDDYGNKNPLDYYVRAVKDREPEITLRAPGRDRRAMPLEEVAIEVSAEDDYALTQFELAYSVVGTGNKTVDLLEAKNNPKTASGSTLLYLEDLEVQPGDVISYSVTAKDNNGLSGPAVVVSDIYFLEVIPTDHQFSRADSGGGGGMGGGGSDGTALVKIQKDVIAATWKLRNRQHKVAEDAFAEDGGIIRDSQAEVARRAQMSINRLTERGSFDDPNYQQAVLALRRAIEAMQAAVTSLEQLALAPALESEQHALQAILQAESQVNKTEVAMTRNGGGGGGQNREREDLRELFEMEMGELENRYELPQQQAGQNNQAQNEALDKLKELARRQERLTRSQRELARREDQMDEEQKRRQLEQLRREQEQLRQQLGELSRSMQQNSGQAQAGGGGSQDTGQAQLQQAMEQMQQAAETQSSSQAAAKGQKALDSLRKQTEQMDAGARQSIADLQEAVRQRSEKLVQQQRQLRRMVEEKSRNQSLSNSRSETVRSGQTEQLSQQQTERRRSLDQLGRDLREIATRADDDEQRALQEAHNITRDLRPIQEKMDTSKQILQRGMLNLSLKLEAAIETELAGLQRRIQGMGGSSDGGQQNDQVVNQVRQLRQSLQELQRQLGQRSSQSKTDQSDSSQPPEQSERLSLREGERSQSAQQADVAEPGQSNEQGRASRKDMQQSLERSRELAGGLAQMGLGGEDWAGSARSLRSSLTQRELDAFLRRPELLQGLLTPLVELENQLRVQAELSRIDNKLYSSLEEEIPEQYKSQVETYYRVLSESKTQR